MAASRTTLGTTKASLLVQAVNVRPRSMSNLLDGAIGNLFWWGAALANPTDSELNHLVGKMRGGVSLFDDVYLKSLQGEEGFEAMSNLLDQLENRMCWLLLAGVIKTKWGKGIEAWITLVETRMAALEQDPEFLTFASPNPLVTRRFVFDAKSITTLRNKARNEQDEALPSRIEAITSFIWKHYMAASRTTLGTTKASLLVQAVNMRPRSMSKILDGAIGNLFWWGAALANPADSELNHLVEMIRGGVSLFDDDYLKSLQGEEGFEAMSNLLDQLEEIISIEKPDVLAFTSWCYQGVYELDFGFGEPVWAAVMGKAGVEFRNLVVYFETKWGKGIEAWITLDETRMAALEQDPEFLAFASPNPVISSL
ncbi:vinorine synthase-like [Tripterygium wilfordii]|uniref:Vinorine synthase-like n=1 Tax=Tripterygium wilfordii TaxID=458696 RepID=A0A7J7C6U7_TRIWF|nr:vinorine synthase-like [Tripterygium wilfordii]